MQLVWSTFAPAIFAFELNRTKQTTAIAMTTLQSQSQSHEALFLPVDEDSLLFQICFYYGLLVVFVEVAVPLLFRRRLRLHLPLNVLPQAPPVLSDDAFQQQKTQLGAKLRELQRASSAAKTKKLLRRKSLVRLRNLSSHV